MSRWIYILILLAGVFLSSVSQVLLKKSAMREHASAVREYLNPLVISAYALFLLSTLISVWAYRGVSLGLGAVLEATGYLYVTAFGVLLFQERLNRKKILALALILSGIILSSLA